MTKNKTKGTILILAGLLALIPIIGVSAQEMGGESPGEHGSMEKAESGGSEGQGGAGEESATQYGLTDIYNETRAGAHLVLEYDTATNMFVGTVENTINASLSHVRVEIHLSNGVELGPTKSISLDPGERVGVILAASNQPCQTWGAHPEVGGCGGESGSMEGSEGGSESGSGEHGSMEGSESMTKGSESMEGAMSQGGAGEESATQYCLTDTYDEIRSGARLVLDYDAVSNEFKGTVENTLDEVLPQVRVEIHLSNGVELGPTPPIDMEPGEKAVIVLRASSQPFQTWGAHPEVGGSGGESGSMEGSEGGSESGSGEHGSMEGSEGGSESGSGEHGSGGS